MDRSWEDEGRSAFPCGEEYGMTLRDWFATFAPESTDIHIANETELDRHKNPHNEGGKPPLRSQKQIRADDRYIWADSMLIARAK